MARSSAGAVVAGLTAAALAAIGFLAYQADAAQDRAAGTGHAASDDRPPAHHRTPRPAPVPADSGRGERVVYALHAERVWLVGAGERVHRTFRVVPSTVSPEPGSYKVTSRSATTTGSDGVPVEHVVRFASAQGVTVGFSAAVDGTLPTADPSAAPQKTGGVRERRADGAALWRFATLGTPVVVVR